MSKLKPKTLPLWYTVKIGRMEVRNNGPMGLWRLCVDGDFVAYVNRNGMFDSAGRLHMS